MSEHLYHVFVNILRTEKQVFFVKFKGSPEKNKRGFQKQKNLLNLSELFGAIRFKIASYLKCNQKFI